MSFCKYTKECYYAIDVVKTAIHCWVIYIRQKWKYKLTSSSCSNSTERISYIEYMYISCLSYDLKTIWISNNHSGGVVVKWKRIWTVDHIVCGSKPAAGHNSFGKTLI